MAPLVSIIIISFNTRELTLACLKSVHENTRDITAEVIVLDNASEDGSAEAIRSAFPQVLLIASTDNLGFAAGNNRAAADATGEYILLLNPDTVVLDGAIANILSFAQHHTKTGIVGGRTRFADMSLNPTSCWKRPGLWSLFCVATGLSRLLSSSRFFNPEAMPEWDRSTERSVDIVTGCFLLLKKSLWQELHGFDETFFMYAEDADLCLRAKTMHLDCRICPDAQIIHLGGRSEPSRAGKMASLFRAKAQLLQKHNGNIQTMIAIRLFDLWTVIRILGFSIAAISGKNAERYQTWVQVWKLRRKWHDLTICSEDMQ